MTAPTDPPSVAVLEEGDQALCKRPVQRVFRRLYVFPVVGTTLFLSSLADCVLFWRSAALGTSSTCFGFSWIGFFAALAGQIGFVCAWILIALFVKTFRGASSFRWFAGLLVLIFYEVIGAGVFVSILRALQTLVEDSASGSEVDALDRGVLSWVVLTSWCTFVLLGFYRCVFPPTQSAK